MMTIGDLLRDTARRIPEHEALVWEGERISWRELNRSVNRLANGLLMHGIRPGDRIAFIAGNSADTVRLYYAIAKAGCVAVPVMARSVAREIRHIVDDVGASALFADADQSASVLEALPHLASVHLTVGMGAGHGLPHDLTDLTGSGDEQEPSVAVAPDSPYAIQYTSGTTGAPKGCVLRHDAKVLSRLSMLAHVPYAEDDRALLFMPLTASLGADMLHTHVLRGMTTVLLPRFDPARILGALADERISVLYAMESTFDRLLDHPDLRAVDWSGLRYLFATSATRDLSAGMATLHTLRGFRARVWTGFGCTEGGGWLTFLGGDVGAGGEEEGEVASHPRSVGRACLLADVSCVDEEGHPVPDGETGELVLSSPWLFAGYWGQPERTAEVLRDGRYFTGDLARRDEHGYLHLVGRMKDMIKTGGLNVYPIEIEQILLAHPSVREAAVIGVPDPQWGEKVVACVIGEEGCDRQVLLDHCRTQLAGYKVPKAVTLMDDFPRDPVGKILKRQLRDRLAEQVSAVPRDEDPA
ncbi:class I adenylate-forming enzyme family protein [Streptomyces sp. NPDC090493]|uniref:class I adenylate-forming enzyme family protein n=1 Tax=Streptomyces sp. NPDC090493 TaxID=3365964 RepID=UPI003803192F